MRWAKVPERLLDVLVAVPKDERESVAPGTALAGYVALAVTANFQTGEVKCTPAQLATRIGVTPRAARRTFAALERVGALLREGDRLWLRGEDADLQVPDDTSADLTVRPADLQVPETDLQVRAPEPIRAGHEADSANPSEQSFSQSTATASQEREELHLVEMRAGEQMELSPQVPFERAESVWDWFRDPDRLSNPMPALRAASRPPGPGARLHHPGGTSGDDAETVAGLGRPAADTEGGADR